MFLQKNFWQSSRAYNNNWGWIDNQALLTTQKDDTKKKTFNGRLP